LILTTLITGLAYPLLMTLFSQIVFPHKANGSLIKNNQGQVIGSELIGQTFKGQNYFWSRPSAIDYNPMPSGGSNLGPTSVDLVGKVKEREKQGLVNDLLFASGSGLDPHISPEGARAQIGRIAQSRGTTEQKIGKILDGFIEQRQMRILGEKRVNVLMLNLALDERLK